MPLPKARLAALCSLRDVVGEGWKQHLHHSFNLFQEIFRISSGHLSLRNEGRTRGGVVLEKRGGGSCPVSHGQEFAPVKLIKGNIFRPSPCIIRTPTFV